MSSSEKCLLGLIHSCTCFYKDLWSPLGSFPVGGLIQDVDVSWFPQVQKFSIILVKMQLQNQKLKTKSYIGYYLKGFGAFVK